MVINGQAGMQIMGDWAKGEWLNAGKVPGTDVLCFRYPGTQGTVTFNSDAFGMMKISEAEQDAQFKLAAAIMDPAFQESFNLKKGSIPARNDVPDTNFDACGKKAIADAKEATASECPDGQHGARPRGVGGGQGRRLRRGHRVLQQRHELGRRRQEAVGGGRQREVTTGWGVGPVPAPPSWGRGRMAIAVEQGAAPGRSADWLSENLPKIVLAPTFVITLFFVYGFILWTTFLSFTKSRFMPVTTLDGLRPYQRLWANSNWWTALENLAIFGILYIGLATIIGLLLAILLDQKIRGEGVLRTIYLYPMALSFIVTGTAWKWMLNPGLGIEKLVQRLGLRELHARLDRPARHGHLLHRHRRDLAVQRLRHGDVPGRPARRRRRDRQGGADRRRLHLQDLLADHHSADASGVPVLVRHPLAPRDQELRPDRGPDRRRAGHATGLPAIFMYKMTFTRNEVALGAASARHDAHDRGRDHGALPLFRAPAGGEERPWLTRPRPSPAPSGTSWLRVLLWAILILFALFYLAAALRDDRDLLEERRGDPRRQPPGLPAGPELRRLGQGLVLGLRRRRSARASAGSSATRSRW